MCVTGALVFWTLFAGYQSYETFYSKETEPYPRGGQWQMECSPDPDNPQSAVYFVRTGSTDNPNPDLPSKFGSKSLFVLAKGSTIDPDFVEALGKFPHGDRYSFSEVNSTTGRVRLLISNLQPQDSGTVGCIVASATNISEQISVERIHGFMVKGPLERVQWKRRDIRGNITELDIMENNLLNIRCFVRFSTVTPDISVYLAGADGVDDEDVTSDFNTDDCCGISTGNYHGFTFQWRSFNVKPLRTFKAEPRYNGRKLVCQASIVQGEDRIVNNITLPYSIPVVMTSSFTLNVTYAPRINCSATDNHMTTICKVYGNPLAEVSYDRDDVASPNLTQFTVNQAGDGTHVEVTSMTEDDAALTYTLIASNSLGTSHHKFGPGTVKSGSSRAYGAAPATMMLLMLSAVTF